MERIVERENLKKALERVKRNKGAAGVDGMTVDELSAYLKEKGQPVPPELQEARQSPTRRKVEEPDLSPADEAALDRVWARLVAPI